MFLWWFWTTVLAGFDSLLLRPSIKIIIRDIVVCVIEITLDLDPAFHSGDTMVSLVLSHGFICKIGWWTYSYLWVLKDVKCLIHKHSTSISLEIFLSSLNCQKSLACGELHHTIFAIPYAYSSRARTPRFYQSLLPAVFFFY